MSNNIHNAEDLGAALYEYVVRQFVVQKKNSAEITDMLVAKGFNHSDVYTFVKDVEQVVFKDKKKKANKNMFYGGIWCVGGIIVTVASYSAASSGGGKYVFAWGAIIFGAIQFFKGLADAS